MTIREALQELVAWSQTAELKIVDHEENGRKTSLIRDWGDVFLELGDKQSLLASLKESQFFKTFEDQGNTYEVKRRDIGYISCSLKCVSSAPPTKCMLTCVQFSFHCR